MTFPPVDEVDEVDEVDGRWSMVDAAGLSVIFDEAAAAGFFTIVGLALGLAFAFATACLAFATVCLALVVVIVGEADEVDGRLLMVDAAGLFMMAAIAGFFTTTCLAFATICGAFPCMAAGLG